jgi:hypothetical protein
MDTLDRPNAALRGISVGCVAPTEPLAADAAAALTLQPALNGVLTNFAKFIIFTYSLTKI